MWFWTRKFETDVRLDDKTAVVTGANGGIGKETAKDLYQRGAKVLLLCRDQEKAKEALKDIQEQTAETKDKNGKLILYKLDLGDLSSVRECAKEILQNEDKIDLLINNAGVMGIPDKKTKDNFESHFGINHLGHFLLTLLLLPKIILSKSARIVTVSSLAHQLPFYGGRINLEDLNYNKRKFSQLGSYAQSKLANVLFSAELHRRLRENGITHVNTYSLHPGIIATDLGRNFNQIVYGSTTLWQKLSSYVLLSPKTGARTTLYCALEKKLNNESGLYYSDCAKKRPSSTALNEEIAKKLWNISLESVGLKNYNLV